MRLYCDSLYEVDGGTLQAPPSPGMFPLATLLAQSQGRLRNGNAATFWTSRPNTTNGEPAGVLSHFEVIG